MKYMRGTLNRPRFTIKYPDGTMKRFGCCDPKIDSGRTIVFCDGRYELIQYHQGESHPPIAPEVLAAGTLAANGYYNHEHDKFVPVEEFWRTM